MVEKTMVAVGTRVAGALMEEEAAIVGGAVVGLEAIMVVEAIRDLITPRVLSTVGKLIESLTVIVR